MKNLPNWLSAFRLVLTVLFLYLLFAWQDQKSLSLAGGVSLIVLLFISEASDILDGWLARRYRWESSFGKIFDPFVDMISHLSYFWSFYILGLLPLYLPLIVMYREFIVNFLRTVQMQLGFTQAARNSGKMKSLSYAILSALLTFQYNSIRIDSWKLWGIDHDFFDIFLIPLVAVICLFSLFDYTLSFYRFWSKWRKKSL